MIKVYRGHTPDVKLDLRQCNMGVNLCSVGVDGKSECLIARIREDGIRIHPFTGNMSGIREFNGLPVVTLDRHVDNNRIHVEGDRVRLERCGNLTRHQAVVLAWGILNACQGED